MDIFTKQIYRNIQILDVNFKCIKLSIISKTRSNGDKERFSEMVLGRSLESNSPKAIQGRPCFYVVPSTIIALIFRLSIYGQKVS